MGPAPLERVEFNPDTHSIPLDLGCPKSLKITHLVLSPANLSRHNLFGKSEQGRNTSNLQFSTFFHWYFNWVPFTTYLKDRFFVTCLWELS